MALQASETYDKTTSSQRVLLVGTDGAAYEAGGSSGLTDAQLRASAVPVSLSGVSTSAKQDTIISHLDGVEGLLSGTLTVNTISGFATSAKQDTELTELSDKLDEATFTGRIGEVQASPTANTVLDRLKTINTSLGSLSLDTTGLATEAKQDTAIGHLDGVEGLLTTIDADTSRIPALGQATMANSVPVTIASNQGAVPVSGTFWQATQPVSGTVTSNLGTLNGAATTAKQDDIVAAIEAIPGGAGVQYTEGDTDTTITGTALLWEGGSNTLTSVAAGTPLPVTTISGFATSAKQDTIIGHVDGIETLLTAIDGHVDGIEGSVDGIEGLLGGTLTVGSHAVTNAGTFAVQATEANGANVTLGAKADAKSTATDTTAVTAMSVLKQISASVQAPPSQAVTGTFWQATQPVSGTVTANAGTGTMAVSIASVPSHAVTNAGTFAVQAAQSGTWTVNPQRGTSTATSTVAGSASSVQLLASNASRVKATVYNDSTVACYVKEGTTASTTSFQYKLAAGDTVIIDDYTGRLDAIWDSASGNARLGETT